MTVAKSIFITLLTLLYFQGFSQGTSFKEWHLLDQKADSIHGISLNKAYDFLKGKKSKQVIIAVIDSGIDTTHEDLKNVLWHNPGEIPGNDIDDDHNGYIDDIYGWNFIGGKDGKNVRTESKEAARVYHRYKAKFDNKNINESQLSAEEKEEYVLWGNARELLKAKPEDQVEMLFVEMMTKAAKKHEKILKEDMKKDTFTVSAVEDYTTTNPLAKRAKLGYITFMKIMQIDREETNVFTFEQLDEYLDEKKKQQEAKDIPPANYRNEIVKDDYNNINDWFYGNNDVMGPIPLHGTHVSGTIAAQRNNGIGCNGIADNVRIMMIRAVPDGDEYDKDIALAIKYAVDNGAKVINMSFGKGISPEKLWVDDAVKYAEAKDVLLVHAAGNDNTDVDSSGNFPCSKLKKCNCIATNFITVGACSDPKISGDFVAEFSNYGRQSVDVFAPGVKIYSTIPGGNTYGFLKGTSMASPVVAGLAALIRSYYPSLSAKEVKEVIEKSVVSDTSIHVLKPGTKDSISMSDLCTSGGFINAYNAVKLAAQIQASEATTPIKTAIRKQPLPKSTFKNLSVKQ